MKPATSMKIRNAVEAASERIAWRQSSNMGKLLEYQQRPVYSLYKVSYPVLVVAIASKSCAEYMQATATMKEVTNPIDHVERRARGTASRALVASSARWMAPSIPAYM